MEEKQSSKQKRMQWVRLVFISMTLGIVLLSLQYLISGWIAYQYYALGLAVFCLVIISLIINKIIKTED